MADKPIIEPAWNFITDETVTAPQQETLKGKLGMGASDSPEFDGIQFDAAVSEPTHSEGKLFYDQTNKTLALHNDEADITLQFGQEEWIRVYNDTGAEIANGSAVYITGVQSGFPEVTKGIATSKNAADVIGCATHLIGIAEYGYVTRGGIVRDINTVGFTAGQSVFLSEATAGEFQATTPSLPNYEVHLGHVVEVGASGSIFVEVKNREADYVEIAAVNDGMAFDKPELAVVSDGGLQLDIQKVGGGDIDYLIDGSRSTLDCTTGSGVGGKARVALTAGADVNTPATNYIYVTDGSGTLTLNASTTLPTGAFGWLAKVVVPDATTWATTGEYVIQRYAEAFQNDSRGALSHTREKLRALGAVYISGGTQTLTIDTGAAPDSVHLEVASASVYQLHRQTFPAFTTGPYYYGNGTNIYEKVDNLNEVLELSDGTAILDNQRYNLVIWGAVNYDTGDCKLFVNVPNGIYTNDSQAAADRDNTADYSVPDDMRSAAFMIARVCLRYDSNGGGQFTAKGDGAYSLLGSPVGARTGGSGAVASTEFGDSTFRVFDDTDPTKQVAFEASSVTSATTRTLTVPDADGTIALLSDLSGDFAGSIVVDNILAAAGDAHLTIYNSSDGLATPVDYERGFVRWDTDQFVVGTESGGTGVGRDFTISNAGFTVFWVRGDAFHNNIAIGHGATSTGGFSGVAIGKNSNAHRYCIAMGEDSNASLNYSVALGYSSNTVAYSSSAIGCWSLGNRAGQLGFPREVTGLKGNHGFIPATVQTTDGTATTFTNVRLTDYPFDIPIDHTLTFSGVVTAQKTDQTANAGWKVEGIIKNDSGVTTLIASSVTEIGSDNSSAWTLAVSADDTNDCLKMELTAEATVNATASLHFVEQASANITS